MIDVAADADGDGPASNWACGGEGNCLDIIGVCGCEGGIGDCVSGVPEAQ